jgi:hypothetical protein
MIEGLTLLTPLNSRPTFFVPRLYRIDRGGSGLSYDTIA